MGLNQRRHQSGGLPAEIPALEREFLREIPWHVLQNGSERTILTGPSRAEETLPRMLKGWELLEVFIRRRYQRRCHSQPPEVCGAGIELFRSD